MVKKGFVRTLIAGLGMAALAGFTMAASAEGTLNVQFVPTNNYGSMEAKTGPFADYLSEKLGMDVNVTLATDYSTIVEAMASGKVDLGIMPPAAYVQARNLDAAEAILSSHYEVLRTWLTKNLRGIKMIVTPGNHDRKAEFRSGWLGMKAQGEKEADLPYNEHWSGDELDVMSLDSAVFGESDGCFVQGQADWLAEELKKAGDRPSLLMTHHHLLDAHEGIRAVSCPAEIAQLVKESHVTAVMAGHTHHCFAGYWQRKPYYTADGMSFYGIDEPDGSVRFEEKYGYNYYETKQGLIMASEQRTFSENRELANIIFF